MQMLSQFPQSQATVAVDEGLQMRLTSALLRCHDLQDKVNGIRAILFSADAPKPAASNTPVRPPISGCTASLVGQLHDVIAEIEVDVEAIRRGL